MKMITSTLTGLASSLFLNAGLAQVAEKLDPVARPDAQCRSADLLSSEMSGLPCGFSKQAGR
jgi:hypothetical protein